MCDLIEVECVKAECDLLAACRQSLAHGALLATRSLVLLVRPTPTVAGPQLLLQGRLTPLLPTASASGSLVAVPRALFECSAARRLCRDPLRKGHGGGGT